MQTPATNERLRWVVTFGVLALTLSALAFWLRTREEPDPAMLFPPRPAPALLTATATPEGDAVSASLPVTATVDQAIVTPEPALIGVDVVGAVQQPGLYYLPENARVDDAIRAAGGFAPDANREAINVAVRLKDEQQVRVPRASEEIVQAESVAAAPQAEPPPSSQPAAGPLDLNTADAKALESLPRIGPVLAQRIVDYRTIHGPFTNVEQLQEIEGIGAGMIDAIRDLVTVTR